MSTDDETTTPPRPGTYADLSRRMDRMESRQDNNERQLGELKSTVERVELNQKHAADIEELRFSTVKTALDQGKTTLEGFITRVEGIINGEVQTAQTRLGAQMVDEYRQWKAQVDARLPNPNEVVEYRAWKATVDSKLNAQDTRNDKQAGVLASMGAVKQLIVLIMAVAGTIVAIVDVLQRMTS